jgi:glutaredoxin 2
MVKDYNGNLAQATAADWQRLVQKYMELLAEQVGITLYKD